MASKRKWLAALGLAGMLTLAGLGVASPASAYTTAPTNYENTSCHPSTEGGGSCTLTLGSIPTTGTYYAAVFVSSDSPWPSGAQTVSILENETSWGAAATEGSYDEPELNSGYTGIFTKQLSSGSHTLTVEQTGSQVGDFLAEAIVFANSSGFEGAATMSSNNSNPTVGITASQSNEWELCVGHNWSESVSVNSGASGFNPYVWRNDTTLGDTMAVYSSASNTSGSGTSYCGPGTTSWSGDEDYVSGIAVKGS